MRGGEPLQSLLQQRTDRHRLLREIVSGRHEPHQLRKATGKSLRAVDQSIDDEPPFVAQEVTGAHTIDPDELEELEEGAESELAGATDDGLLVFMPDLEKLNAVAANNR